MKTKNKILISLIMILSILISIQIHEVYASADIFNTNKNLTYKELENHTILISGFEIGTKILDITKDDFLQDSENTSIIVFDTENNNITSNEDALLATGYKLNCQRTNNYVNSTEDVDDAIGPAIFARDYTIVMYGDVNGDGKVSAVDALAIVKNKLGTLLLTSEEYIEAGRVIENTRKKSEVPSALDALAVVKYKLDSENNPITQKLMSEEDTENPEQPENPDVTTPLELHGSLSVSGTNIVDKNGDKFQLKGVSTHGIAWFPQYVNQDAFTYMRDEWGINVVRFAMYSNPTDGYTRENWDVVKNGVNYATNSGLYAIIDWHILNDNNPNTYKSEAIEFFKEMATTYKDNENVIYEICNEPNGDVTWLNDIKPYAEEVIAEIREIDTDAIILCGTPTYSQDVDIVSQNPITEYENIMYTLHFYAATHKDNIRTKLTTALDNGLPVFVSEFGICDASGNGAVDVEEANTWMSLLNKNNISYVCWNLSNKNETSSILASTTNKTTGWTEEELSQTGKWLVKTFKSAKIYYKFVTDTSGIYNITINIKDGNGIEKVTSTLDINGVETSYELFKKDNENNILNVHGDVIEMKSSLIITNEDKESLNKITTVITEKDGKTVTFEKVYERTNDASDIPGGYDN